MAAHVLIADADETFAAAVTGELREYGHTTETAVCGATAWRMINTRRFDVVLLDRGIPTLDGISVLKEARTARLDVSVLMTSVIGQPRDKAKALNAGADDYLVKPLDPDELNARINVQLRKHRPEVRKMKEIVLVGDLKVYPEGYSAFCGSKTIFLCNVEMKLLLFFANNCNVILSRSTLLKEVWGHDSGPSSNLVEVYIRRLRQKLKEAGGDSNIRTVRGAGYMLQC